jgi:hypothetical protein
MGSDDVRFDVIEGQVEPPDGLDGRVTDEQLEEPPVAPDIPAEPLVRTLRRLQKRQERLRAD